MDEAPRPAIVPPVAKIMVVGKDLVQVEPRESVPRAFYLNIPETHSLNVDWYVTLSPAGGVQLFSLRMGAS